MAYAHGRYPWLALPHNIQVAPNEAVARKSVSMFPLSGLLILSLPSSPSPATQSLHADHPDREVWAAMGYRFQQPFHLSPKDSVEEPDTRPPHGTCRAQVVRSVSKWSHGVVVESSIQAACERKAFFGVGWLVLM
jgi:phospholipase D1/2